LISRLKTAPRDQAEQFINGLDTKQLAALRYDWSVWARPEQLPPPNEPAWAVWLIKTGRGWGKTRTGAETVRQWASTPGTRIALGGKEPDDYRGTMVEGEAGILATAPPWNKPKWFPSHSPPELVWENGSRAMCFSGEEPDSLRGPSHHKAWIDELAKFKKPDAFWDNLMLGLRLGQAPQVLVTTTPRPMPIIRALMKHPLTKVTQGSTYENLENLSPLFKQTVLDRYEGTRLGRQEVLGELLEDTPGALWTARTLESNRKAAAPDLVRIVVAVDPPAADEQTADTAECGIMVAGVGDDGEGYLIDDRSLQGSPNEWAKAAVMAYHMHHADCLIAEANNGGAMVKATIQNVDLTVPVRLVYASKGKHIRAEPISTLDERGRLHLVGYYKELEDQLTTWVPGAKSPDRLDAYVWVYTELFGSALALELSGGGETAVRMPEQYGGQEIDGALIDSLKTEHIYWPGR
jgi:phage terminase large subunit-like protein